MKVHFISPQFFMIFRYFRLFFVDLHAFLIVFDCLLLCSYKRKHKDFSWQDSDIWTNHRLSATTDIVFANKHFFGKF